MGTVNIFLGGTGKHIAEDIQDSRDFYGLSIGEPVAFDLDAATRPGVDLRGFVHPRQETIDSVGEVARGWAAREPGPELGPADDAPKPGPQCSPEQSVLVAVGKGIAANPAPADGLYALRGHGLTIFSALFDPSLAIAGAGDGHRLRNLIRDRVREARNEGGDLCVNLVTSTAGGTGAGTVVPLALWLREEYPGVILTLLAVTPTAFASVLRGSPNMEELAAKGRSGTYAMFRELSFLQGVGDPQANFSPRALPATDKGIAYTPGQPLFSRVYWFGGRDANEPEHAFEEAGALLRILSNENTAAELRGKTGNHPLMSVGAVTAIEYPRLRLQRKLVSGVLVAAYERLRAARPTFVGGDAIDREVSLLDYVGGDTGRGLGAWFSGQRHAALSLESAHAPLGGAAAETLAARTGDEAGIEDYASVPRGARIRGPNYEADDAGWKAYQAEVTEGLRDVAQANQRKLGDAIPKMRAGEETAFAEWLRGKAFDEWLSGGGDGSKPDGVEDVQALLDRLDQDARTLEQRVGADNFIPGDTVKEADDRINDLSNKLDKPADVKVDLNWWQRILGFGAAAGLFFAFVLGLSPVWDGVSRFGEFAGTSLSELLVWAGGVGIAIFAFMVVRWLFLRSAGNAASLRVRRQEAEDRLFAAYAERDRVRALRWLHQELCGRDGKTPLFRELRGQIESVKAAVKELDDLYDGLRAQAASEVTRAAANPDHVRATVGDCLEQDQRIADSIVPEIAKRLRVDARLDPNRRICALAVRLEPLDGDDDQVTPASAAARDVLDAIAPDHGAANVAATDVANHWKDALWGLVNWKLGENLPRTFDVALQRCEGGEDAATAALVDRLNRIEFPRRPSVDLRVPASDPVFRQLYAGSADIRARFSAALQHHGLDSAKRNALMQYAAAGQAGQDVGSLGEQIVFLDLWADDKGQAWAPNVISNAVEADVALRTYYDADPGAPDQATANQTCFTVIPELLAATKLELDGTINPLAPAVVARLLGSDLDAQGPTYAELFHLLRARERIILDRTGSGPEARAIVRLSLDDREPIGLVDYALGGVDDRVFGAGRAHVILFDAFCEFMRFDGTPIVAGQEDKGPFTGATLLKGEWANDPRRVARLQRAAVLHWYEGDIDDDCDRMIRVLEGDLRDMANGDRIVRESWERAMRRLLDGEERRRIRRTWLRD